ncbi:DUF5677 domain-containing protein [Priestia megaterium]|uniref:DUF5677 domain-containing protein n=1 Tax=Priestia megaterium TaxID=1404 RepID=UPI00203E09E6|nr:DUF5677 domain-containing protein [Priestia megaterium]MCM3546581.1 DUF5677 domain-containing protein [Priestia megaterium]
MGRKSNEKKRRKEADHSSIASHKRMGKTLIPPFQQIEGLNKVSWSNDRLPEYVWLALIVSLDNRDESLEKIRRVSKFFRDLREEHRPMDLSLTSLGNLEEGILERFLGFLCNELYAIEFLLPLSLFDNIPGKEVWHKFLKIEDKEKEWEKLYIAVAKCLDHQSQEATDCRWARVYYSLTVNAKIGMPENMVGEIIYYPNEGDMRSVRPTIRTIEMMLNVMPDGQIVGSNWSNDFWEQGIKDTPCWSLDIDIKNDNQVKLDVSSYEEVMYKLKEHFHLSKRTSGIDSKLDAIFGLSMYCLEVLGELLQNGNNTSILSRLGLRTITECYITLSYLCIKDDEELWQMYRSYGSGQAKLAFLKLDELEIKPNYIDTETLKALAGEDQWEEFVEINLGHWESTNLRKMSETAKVKEEYNAYYDWTSGFAHGQWAAVRNTVFDTCGNPMHRLHRIPKEKKQNFNDVTEDAKRLCNNVLDIINKSYPNFSLRIK